MPGVRVKSKSLLSVYLVCQFFRQLWVSFVRTSIWRMLQRDGMGCNSPKSQVIRTEEDLVHSRIQWMAATKKDDFWENWKAFDMNEREESQGLCEFAVQRLKMSDDSVTIQAILVCVFRGSIRCTQSPTTITQIPPTFIIPPKWVQKIYGSSGYSV